MCVCVCVFEIGIMCLAYRSRRLVEHKTGEWNEQKMHWQKTVILFHAESILLLYTRFVCRVRSKADDLPSRLRSQNKEKGILCQDKKERSELKGISRVKERDRDR